MKQSQFRATLITLLTSLTFLFLTILFCIITKDEWQFFGTAQLVAAILLIISFPILMWLVYQFGRRDERHRQRTRINDFMATTYQIEPHGIRFSQHRREG